MSFVKRVQLSAMALVAVALFSPTPALAGGGIKLVPTGIEPGASGRASWGKAHVIGVSEYGITYLASVSVTCKGLTPGETYYVYCLVAQIWSPPFWVPLRDPFTASETGTGSARDTISYRDGSPKTIEVRNAEGVVVLIE